MFNWRQKSEWLQLARYYMAGVINLGFGYLLFVILIALGLQVYLAQALAYALGVLFNFFTYSRIAFAGHKANKISYVSSYIISYLLSVISLWVTLKFIHSPYIAGLLVTITVSLVNYFILKRLVFRSPDAR